MRPGSAPTARRSPRRALGRPALFLNDADAAGVAEMRWGAGRGSGGIVIMVTFGTGIGTALFCDGRLFPNTELGHLELRGMDAEKWASAHVRTAEGAGFPRLGRARERVPRSGCTRCSGRTSSSSEAL